MTTSDGAGRLGGGQNIFVRSRGGDRRWLHGQRGTSVALAMSRVAAEAWADNDEGAPARFLGKRRVHSHDDVEGSPPRLLARPKVVRGSRAMVAGTREEGGGGGEELW